MVAKLSISVAALLASQLLQAQCMNQNSVNDPTNVKATESTRTSDTDVNSGTITLSQFYAKRGILPSSPKKQPQQDPLSPDYVEPCYGGGNAQSVIFVTAYLERVEIAGESMRDLNNWQHLTATFFEMPPPSLESGGGGATTPTPSNPTTPDPKQEICKAKQASCEKINDYWYNNAIASCNGIKPGLPGMDFLVEPIVSDCRDQALGNYKKKMLTCDLGYQLCMRQ